MTQQEYIEAIFTLEQEARENKRAHAVQMQLLDDKHRENVQTETDRYNIARLPRRRGESSPHPATQRRIVFFIVF